MKKILNIIPILLSALFFFSCAKEEAQEKIIEERPEIDYEGQKVTVYFGVQMPEPDPATKALGEQPNITSLHVAVFGSSGYLKEYNRAEPVEWDENEGQYVPGGGYVSAEGEANKKCYKVTLSITTSRIRVHLIANGPETLDFDYESTVMSKMASTGGNDAYWQRILLNNGIYADKNHPGYYATPPQLVIDPDFDLDEEGHHQMALIPLVRNFAKLTVVADPVADSHFTIDSFAVVNVPDKGTIAPYNTTSGEFMMDYQEYGNLDAIKGVYPGIMPSGAHIDKSYPSETDFINRTNGVVAAGGAVYMYERPVPTADATILIVKGTYTDPKTGNQSTGFYKIDMMDGGEYLPILRNFRYQITLQRVNRVGKLTVIAAINGAGSADISADISTASQVNLSDGNSAISVEYTEKVLPIGGTYTLGVSFTPDVSTGVVDNTLVTYELKAAEANGAVIASEDDISYDSSTGTLTYKTTDVDQTHTKSQKLRVIGTSTTSRLYRDITIRLLPQQTMTVTCIPEIEASTGTPQTVTVAIPKELPRSIFPLQFKVEAAAKSLTPNANDLPVEPGETIVDGRSGKSFQFIKTVSYSDYLDGYSNTDSYSRFTCEFKSIIPESNSDIYVSNQYFATGSTSFVTYQKRFFSGTRFNVSNAVNEDDPVQFYFVMDAEHEEVLEKLIPEVVHVYLTGLIPDSNPLYENELQRTTGNHYIYTVLSPGYSSQTLHLVSTGETAHYAVELRAEYYEDKLTRNAMNSFSNPTFGTVYYGRGWPTTFSFTVPNTYTIPAGGIDVELTLTNLEPNDANITTVQGKYYYHVTSAGTKTINLKTANSQTSTVAVELNHDDFDTLIGTKSDRSYLNIAAGKITNSVPGGSYPFYSQRNTVNVYTDKSLTSQVTSYTTNTNTNKSATNYTAANFASNVVDASTKLYLSMYASAYDRKTYYATTTAETLYNNGGNSTVTFSTNAPGTRVISIETTSTNYSTSNLSYTSDDVTVAFSVITTAYTNALSINNASITVSVPSGYHITQIAINYYNNNYRANTVTVTTGGGSYSYSSPTGTWTAANNTTTSVVLATTKRNNYDTAVTSIDVTVVED